MKVRIKNGKKIITEATQEIEVDIDYTQVYGCFSNLSATLNSVTSFKLLFWLLANKTNKANDISCGIRSYKDFNDHLTKSGQDPITERTYYKCLQELSDTGLIHRHEKNNYAANMFIFWKDDTDKRLSLLSHNMNTGDPVFLNPLESSE